MIKNNKKNFKILSILTIITLCLFLTKSVFAYTAVMPYVNPNKGSSGPIEEPTYHTKEYDAGVQRRWYCTYKDHMTKIREISINAYDDQGRSIVPFTYISLVDFKAGTSIRMNIREYKRASWNIDKDENEYYELLRGRECHYKPDPTCETSVCEDVNTDYNCNGVPEEELAACQYYYETYIKPCLECQEKCKGTSTSAKYISYNEYHKTAADECDDNDTDTTDSSHDEDGTALEWNTCCPKRYDQCHGNAETPPSSLDIIKPWVDRKIVEATVPSAAIMCLEIAKTDTSDIRAIPFVATPSIEIEIVNANDYNKQSLDMKKFSGYKVLIDENFYATTTPRPTKEYEKDPYHYTTPSYFLEDFYANEKSRIKTIDDRDLKKTKLPEDGYEIGLSDEYHVSYEYSPDKVCINRKTSEVNYDLWHGTTTNGYLEQNCYLDDEVKEVENEKFDDPYLDEHDVETWNYFIPLDTPTTTCTGNDMGYFIAISDRLKDPMEPDYCTSILEYMANDTGLLNYSDILLPVDASGNTIGFSGDYRGSGQSNDYDLFKKQGYSCIFSVKTKFNVDQKFYGEETKDNKLLLKGYGFYYRPIDYTKPFPNSIAVDSIWNGLYNEGSNSIVVKNGYTTRLKESFNTITYSTKNVSIKAVRQAAKSKEYTSWNGIKTLTGLSDFVRDYELRREADLSRVYALGCGPDNLDWKGCNQ